MMVFIFPPSLLPLTKKSIFLSMFFPFPIDFNFFGFWVLLMSLLLWLSAKQSALLGREIISIFVRLCFHMFDEMPIRKIKKKKDAPLYIEQRKRLI
jgi:fatty acid desaturase